MYKYSCAKFLKIHWLLVGKIEMDVRCIFYYLRWPLCCRKALLGTISRIDNRWILHFCNTLHILSKKSFTLQAVYLQGRTRNLCWVFLHWPRPILWTLAKMLLKIQLPEKPAFHQSSWTIAEKVLCLNFYTGRFQLVNKLNMFVSENDSFRQEINADQRHWSFSGQLIFG